MHTATLNAIIGKIQTVLEQYMQLEREYVQLAEERDYLKKTAQQQQQFINELKAKFDLLHLTLHVHLLENAEEDGIYQDLRKQVTEIVAMLDKINII